MRLGWQWGIGLMLGFALLYFQDSGKFLRGFPLFLLIVVVAAWYLRSYKYVYLSAAGIRGLPTIGWKWRHIDWQEHLTSKPASLCGLQGKLITSESSGYAVFIPSAILALPAFKANVDQYAGQNHVLGCEA